MALSREEDALLSISKEEQNKLNELIQTFARADAELSITQQHLIALDQWMVTLQKRTNPQSVASTQNESQLLLQYLAGQGNSFTELTSCLSRLIKQKNAVEQQTLIEKAAAFYDDFLFSPLKPRPLASTQKLSDLFKLTKSFDEDSIRTVKTQLLQLGLDDLVKELRSNNSLSNKLKTMMELDSLLALFNKYVFNTNVKTDKPMISLLKLTLLGNDKREELFNSLAKLAQAKNANAQQELLTPYYQLQKSELNPNAAIHLKSTDRKELISTLQENPDPESIPVIEQLYRLQLANSLEILKSATNLFLIKEELKTCFSIIIAIESHISGKPITETASPHELFLKYLSLDDKTVVTKPLFVISHIADFLNAKSTQATQEKLLELKKFQETPAEVNLPNLSREYTTLTNTQAEALTNVIKSLVIDNADLIISHTRRCIKLLHLAQTEENFKKISKDYQVLIETLKFINHLVDYAKLQRVFIKATLEKGIKSINEKFSSLIEIHAELFIKPTETASDQKKFERKLDKFQEKQKKLTSLRNSTIISLFEGDIFLSSFDNQLSLLNRSELQHHLRTVTPEKLKSIMIENQLIDFIQPFYSTWKEENKTVMDALKTTLPLFSIANDYLPGLLSKKSESSDITLRMSTNALKNIANSFSFSSSNERISKIGNYIAEIEAMFSLNLMIEKRLKSLNLAKVRVRDSSSALTNLEKVKLVQQSLPLLLLTPQTAEIVSPEPIRDRTIHGSLDLETQHGEKRITYGQSRNKTHMRSYANVFKVVEVHEPLETSDPSDRKPSSVWTPRI